MLIDRFYSRAQIERLLFRTEDALGRMIYFPNGAFGPGFIVATEEQKQRIIRAYIGNADAFIVTFVVAAFVSSFLNMPPLATGLLMGALGLIWLNVSGRLSAGGLQKSQKKLTWRASQRDVAKVMNGRMMIAIAVFLALVCFAHILVLLNSWSWEAFIRTALSGFGAVGFGYLIYVRYATRDGGG